MSIPYNDKQVQAIQLMVEHADDKTGDQFFVLEGPAGTGKTACISKVMGEVSGRMVMTAPTNKAVRVIRESLADKTIPTCTIYSLLGLQLMASGEVKHIGRLRDDLDLSDYDIVGIDEAGMLNKVLVGYLRRVAEQSPHLRFIQMGDRWQLPPVKESLSEVWDFPKRFELDKVMRTDNQILTFATHVRHILQGFESKLEIKDDYDERGGVFVPKGGLRNSILEDVEAFRQGKSKALAWRNAAVDDLNKMIREELLEFPAMSPWQEKERITLLEPAKNFNDEIIASTDEEGYVSHVDVTYHPIYRSFLCYRIVMDTINEGSIVLWALHESEKQRFEKKKAELAEIAKSNRSMWKTYWQFVESFHNVRHAYAQSSHRAQGSTYNKAYVMWRDIMANPRREEALRCLYVAGSRPKNSLYL